MHELARRAWLVAKNPLVVGAVVAIVLRVLLFDARHSGGVFEHQGGGDPQRYLNQADAIYNGMAFGNEKALTTKLPPGYPVMIATVFFFCHSVAAVRFVQLGLSVASCFIVYFAIRDSSRRLALFAFFLMATNPWIAQLAMVLMSETVSIFLASVSALLLLWTWNGRSVWSPFWLGMSLTALALTAPALLMLLGTISIALLLSRNNWPWRVAAYLAGGALLLMPWQIHSFLATKRFEPFVYNFSTVEDTGFQKWRRSWLLWEDEIRASFVVNHRDRDWDESLERAFESSAERHTANRLLDSERNGTIEAGTLDAWFAERYRQRMAAHPWRVSFGLPLARAVLHWTDLPPIRTARLRPDEVAALRPNQFITLAKQNGNAIALWRLLKGLYTLFFWVLYVSYACFFLFCGMLAIRRGRGLIAAILLATAIYTASGAWLATHAARRQLVWYPVLIISIAFIGPASGSVNGPK